MIILVLLQFSWRRGSKGPRVQGFKGSREGTDTTDLLICEVRPYLSSFGNFAVILYISKQDKLVKSQKMLFSVIPAEAGIQCFKELMIDLDPGFRRGDDFLQDCQTEFV